MKPGLSISLTFGWVGWKSTADKRHLRLAGGIIALTITLYNFDERYLVITAAYTEMCKAFKVNPRAYIETYRKIMNKEIQRH